PRSRLQTPPRNGLGCYRDSSTKQTASPSSDTRSTRTTGRGGSFAFESNAAFRFPPVRTRHCNMSCSHIGPFPDYDHQQLGKRCIPDADRPDVAVETENAERARIEQGTCAPLAWEAGQPVRQ